MTSAYVLLKNKKKYKEDYRIWQKRKFTPWTVLKHVPMHHMRLQEVAGIYPITPYSPIPQHVDVINDMKKVVNMKVGLDLSNATRPFFNRFSRISIDFAVMEKSEIIQCIPVDFGWNDVGGYNSLEEVFEKDEDNNIVKDVKYVQLDSKNNIVISDRESRLITSIGVSNMVIVDTKDALLVCNKDDSQRIKELLKKLG